MYGWIVNGLSSLFEPITGSDNPTERLGQDSGETVRRSGLTAGIQQQDYIRPTKRNYQSVHVADDTCQTEPVQSKRRRRDVVISFVKKTVVGVAGLLRITRTSTYGIGKHGRYEDTKILPVTLGIDELQTSCINTYEWRMDKPAGRLKDRGTNAFRRPSPPAVGSFSVAGPPPGGQERVRDRERRSSLQLLPFRPASVGVAMGTAAAGADTASGFPGPGHNRCPKQCLTVEEAIKRTDKEQYRRLVQDMVSEKHSSKQPLCFHQAKPQDLSLPAGEHKTASFGRARDTAPTWTRPVLATPRPFTWRNTFAPTEARDSRRPDMGLHRVSRTWEDSQHVTVAKQQRPAVEVDLSREVATRLSLVDRETLPTRPDTAPLHASHQHHGDDDYPRLTKDMMAEVSQALTQGDSSLVLSAAFKLRITQRDLATLQEGGWLNDEVINFYLSLVMERSARATGVPRVYSFSTFFFPKLRGGGGGQPGGHGAVRRWTKAVDLFLYDLLLVPLHLGAHWALAVIDLKSHTVRSYDSIAQRHDDICSLLLFYLREEHNAKKARDLDTTKWSIASLRASEIPQQKNSSDCGVFACKYADYVAKGRPLAFRQCHMPLFRKLMIWEILNQKLL